MAGLMDHLPEEQSGPRHQPLGDLSKFFIKLATLLVVGVFLVSYATERLEQKLQTLSYLKGGPQFWAEVEKNLTNLADAPDMPPEKKAALVKKIEAVAHKFRPFVEAFGPPNQNASDEVRRSASK